MSQVWLTEMGPHSINIPFCLERVQGWCTIVLHAQQMNSVNNWQLQHVSAWSNHGDEWLKIPWQIIEKIFFGDSSVQSWVHWKKAFLMLLASPNFHIEKCRFWVIFVFLLVEIYSAFAIQILNCFFTDWLINQSFKKECKIWKSSGFFCTSSAKML